VAAALEQATGVRAALVSGGRGEFTVWVDGARVLDKAELGDFPSDEQAVAAVAAARG